MGKSHSHGKRGPRRTAPKARRVRQRRQRAQARTAAFTEPVLITDEALERLLAAESEVTSPRPKES